MSNERIWKVNTVDRSVRLEILGFETESGGRTIKATKVLEGLTDRDLRGIQAAIQEYLHGDEHG